MKSFLDKIFFRSNNLDYISKNIKDLTKNTPVNKIFEAVNSYSSESEIRYVGGCIRKIINKEKVDDIDLATNLEPKQVCDALKKKDIDFYETGIEHGTITALIDGYKFEITSLREDVFTDGRHAKVKFSKNWKVDASRRDFTINSIYSDKDGNLFDPYDGKNDLENTKNKLKLEIEKVKELINSQKNSEAITVLENCKIIIEEYANNYSKNQNIKKESIKRNERINIIDKEIKSWS